MSPKERPSSKWLENKYSITIGWLPRLKVINKELPQRVSVKPYEFNQKYIKLDKIIMHGYTQ